MFCFAEKRARFLWRKFEWSEFYQWRVLQKSEVFFSVGSRFSEGRKVAEERQNFEHKGRQNEQSV